MATTAASPPPTAAEDNVRLLLPGFLSPETCKELEFVHRSCGTAGYRPSVVSTSLPHLAATGCGHLLLPFVPIRERLRDAVESFFSCHFDLFVEFTGLVSWCKGASIGWHSDDNKPYLRQRAFTAVCYLNNHGKDFKGGLLKFQDGEPSTVIPVAGDAVIYTADNRNVHCVDEPQITCTGFPTISLALTYDVLEYTFLGLVFVQAAMKTVRVHLLHQLMTP